jgi:phage N-6-adenine-methyltransferase
LPGIGSHHSARRLTDEWLTPPHVIEALGPFDLDPCSPVGRPWPTAARHLTVEDDGLSEPWEGRVWLNPPYSDVERWVARLADHNHGTALVFARAETRWFFRWVWQRASALLFLEGRLTFLRPDGTLSKEGHNAGGPSVLVAYGAADRHALLTSGLSGAVVTEWDRSP